MWDLIFTAADKLLSYFSKKQNTPDFSTKENVEEIDEEIKNLQEEAKSQKEKELARLREGIRNLKLKKK